MKLKTLLKRKATLKENIQGVLNLAEKEDRILTVDEEISVRSMKEEILRINSQIDLIDGIDGDEKDGEENDGDEKDGEGEGKTKLSAAAKMSGRPIRGPEAKKEFDSMEHFMETVINNPGDQRLASLYTEPKSEQSMGTGSKGGFAVPTQFIGNVRSIDPAEALVRPRATVIPAGSPPDAEVTIPALDQDPNGSSNQVYAGVVVAKLAEGGLKGVTDYNLKEISLRPHEIAAYIPLTDKLLRNWKAAADWATKLLRMAMTGFEDTQFLTGNGVGGPSGVLDALSSKAIARAVASQIAYADLKKMYERFSGNEAKAIWAASPGTYAQLLGMVGDGGGATNVIKVDQSTGSVTLFGIPLKKHPRMRALGSKGDFALMDLTDYLIKDGSGPIVEVGYASGQWERNKRSIKVTWNVDGKSANISTYRDEDNFEVSKVVVLDVP